MSWNRKAMTGQIDGFIKSNRKNCDRRFAGFMSWNRKAVTGQFDGFIMSKPKNCDGQFAGLMSWNRKSAADSLIEYNVKPKAKNIV